MLYTCKQRLSHCSRNNTNLTCYEKRDHYFETLILVYSMLYVLLIYNAVWFTCSVVLSVLYLYLTIYTDNHL